MARSVYGTFTDELTFYPVYCMVIEGHGYRTRLEFPFGVNKQTVKSMVIGLRHVTRHGLVEIILSVSMGVPSVLL